MEGLVSTLLEDFERGNINRRQLVRTLAMAVVAGPGLAAVGGRSLAAATPSAAPAWRTVHLDHISYQVSDHARSAAWYADLMGWTVQEEAENQTVLAMGDVGQIIIRDRRSPAPRGEGAVTGLVDHISFGIAPWDKDAVKAELVRRGLSPRDDFQDGGFESYHVKDPDGWDLQISNRTEIG